MKSTRTRTSTTSALLLLSLFAASLAQAASSDPLLAILEQSRDDKRGVTLVVDGRDVSLLVTEIGRAFVVGKSQQHERIVVRIDQIDAALK
jgi:hypothetical protein